MKNTLKIIFLLLGVVALFSCEEEIEVDVPGNANSLVVEAYINDRFPALNYVILTRSVDYFSTAGGYVPVKDAQVFVTEGTVNGADTSWDVSTRKQLVEVRTDTVRGFYMDPAQQLLGKQNHVYLLEITSDGKSVRGTTSIPALVPLDSMTYTRERSEATITLHYNEPVAINNNYFIIYRNGSDSTIRTWGFHTGAFTFSDDFINGEYRRQTLFTRFNAGDTVNLWMSSIDRLSYNFWESFDDANRNGGPFATPVTVESNITGGIGCFTGMSTDYKRVVIR
ncbi:MAG: DUF4249 domain-containing protein [Bacteroidia bacterium]|nr:DUF4249 domain-containing protein [Bacteroidia bacterium]MBP7262029.1 DUF4249 domain-containing protein [Bacteroidia bacterium]MBP9181238.1 DUF4249 domain-containing protein [Bacteroidia bacterium]MBP9725453.1 DUF4249 domain-containing protein [Bacteroidia bacterium]